jgi:DNA mismatch endonuclease (patch repair protein)
MKANTKTGNRPEALLRSELHRRGLRFRKNAAIRGDGWLVRPDVVFPRLKVAVFLDGCFWHACPEHGTKPRANEAYWLPKLRRNVERDRMTDRRLRDAGWRVVRVWEHVKVEDAADTVEAAVASRKVVKAG